MTARSIRGSTLFLVAFLVCLAIRLSSLGTLSLWLDEVTTANVAAMDWPSLVANRLANGHFPLYFGLLKILGLAGASEFALRLPSAIFDGLAGAIVACIALRLDGFAAAIGALLLYALMPNLIQYGQEARPYAMMLFFVALATAGQASLFLGTHHPRRATIMATIGTLGSIFAIPAGIVTVLTQHLGVLLAPVRRLTPSLRRAWREHIALSWIGIAIGAAILVPAVRQQAQSATGLLKWQATFSFRQRAAEAFGETYGFVIPHDADRFLPEAGNGLLAAGLLLLMAIGLFARRGSPAHRALAVTAIGTPALYALLGIFSASAGRYMIGMLPAVVLLAASGVGTLIGMAKLRWLTLPLLAALLLALSLQALDTLISPRKYDWRPIATLLDRIDAEVAVFSDVPQSAPVIGHYLQAPARVTFDVVTPPLQSAETLWQAARLVDPAWLLLPAGEQPPDSLTAGAILCRWPFGEMTLTMIARDPARISPDVRSCEASPKN